MVSIWLSPSFWQNLMQYRCSSPSVIFAWNNNVTRAAYALSLTRWLHATEAVCWREKIHECAWRSPPPLHHSTRPVLHYFPRKKITSDTFWTAVYVVVTTENMKRYDAK
jgi:hypothetical protein